MAQPPGFMIYAEDWAEAAEDFTEEEIGEILLGLLRYFQTGEVTEFPDRAVKQFYKAAVKGISRDAERYQERCLKNAHARYKGLCKEKGIEPLGFESWVVENERQRSSTDVTNNSFNPNNNSNPKTKPNNQQTGSIVNDSGESAERGRTFPGGYAPLSEEDYERMRSERLAMLDR